MRLAVPQNFFVGLGLGSRPRRMRCDGVRLRNHNYLCLVDSGPARLENIPTRKSLSHLTQHTSRSQPRSIPAPYHYSTYFPGYRYIYSVTAAPRKEEEPTCQHSSTGTRTSRSGYLTRKRSICRGDGLFSSLAVQVLANSRRT